MILAGFEHRPGVHCGSTALANALRLRGLALSEPMAVGLGAGLGFYDLVSPAISPTHLFQGRTAHLERTACEVLGAPVRERTEEDAPPRPRPLGDAIRDALRRQAREALLDVDGAAGLSAMERFVAELPDWPARAASEADRAWCFRYAYQVIEKRGTGGGLFRALYARFLEEAEAAVSGLASLGLSRRMHALADRWSRLAAAFRAVSEVPGGAVPPPVAELARALARDERRYHEDVAARVR